MNNETAKIYDLEAIKSALSTRADEFVLNLFPDARKQAGCYRTGDINGARGSSLSISTANNRAGSFFDHADNTIKGSPWKLVSLNKGISIREGIVWLANFLHIAPIQTFGTISQAKDPEALKRSIKELNPKTIAYAASRGITEQTLRKFGCGSGVNEDILLPHYDAFGQMGMVKHWPLSGVKSKMWVSADPVHNLFGKDVCDPDTGIQRLVITEGQWDAMACWEMGIPAVSIPSGVSNMKWIEEDYSFLSHFDDIVLLFDNDLPGKTAAEEVCSRLGKERCMIVTLPLKDANDMLQAGRGKEIPGIIASTSREPIAEIVDPLSMKEQVKAYIKGDHLNDGDAFFLPGFDLTFRRHEITLWFGFSGHGKSQAVQNQVMALVSQGKRSCIASFEQPSELTFSQILTGWTAWPNIWSSVEFDKAYEYLSGLVFMYKSRKKSNVKHLIQTFIHAHKRYGVENFFIDNVMTLDIDRGDNTAQAEAADAVRVFAAEYPVHVHIVAHPRKPPENTKTPPGMAEIRGASEWGDMPNNIITVWRDMAKAEQIAEMHDKAAFDEAEIASFNQSTPCGKLIVRKQRATGETPMANFYFDKACKRFMSQPGNARPMFSDPTPWE
jgi:twinkle protein